MPTPVTYGTPSGKTTKTYYNSGTRAAPTWIAITGLSKEKWDPGKPNFFQTEDREMDREIQQRKASGPAKLTATRRRIRGAADSVHTALMATSGMSGTPCEFAVCNDDITKSGAKYDRFFGVFDRLGSDRDVGKFVEEDIEINEVEWYENGVLCPLLQDVAVP